MRGNGGKGRAGDRILSDSLDPVVAEASKSPWEGLGKLLAAQLFAGRNFTERLIKGKTSLPS